MDSTIQAAYAALGAYRAGKRRRVTHHCAMCGSAFEGVITARYCSNKCRQRAKYQRRRPAPEGDDDAA